MYVKGLASSPTHSRCSINVNFLFFLSLFILRERQRQHNWGRGREKEGERGRERGRIPSRLHIVSPEPDSGLELMNHEIMT